MEGLSNKDREQWVLNDEELYNHYKASRQKMSAFIKDNKVYIDQVITKRLGKAPRMGGSL
jgi:hypothetical protein